MSYGAEIVELSSLFFTEEIEYDEAAKEVLAGEQVPEVMAAFKAQLEALESFDAPSIKAAIKAVQKEQAIKGKFIYANSCCNDWSNSWSRTSGFHCFNWKGKSDCTH